MRQSHMNREFRHIFWLLFAGSLAVALLTLGYGAWTVLAMATTHKVLPSIAEAAATNPWPVARAISGFLGATLLAHLGLALGLLLAWRGLSPLIPADRRSRRNLALLLLVSGLATILLWNAALYPYSIYVNGQGTLTTHPAMAALRYGLTGFLLVSALLGLALALRRPLATFGTRLRQHNALLASVVTGVVLAGALGWWLGGDGPAEPGGQPHVIIVGIDAVRPDYTGLVAPQTSLTPNVDAFFASAASFPRTITPMGRTYVAWTSLLTGQEPVTHGRRFNLMPGPPDWPDHALPDYLGATGYRSVYATDDRRFANFDQRHGFDTVIGPKTGVSDFLIASLNDVPLNNVLLATPAGRWLFPHTYANRAAASRYYPVYFDDLLARGIGDVDDGPLFLAAHLALPHWPFFWADSHEIAADELPPDFHPNYARSLIRADQQFAALMALLEARGYLDNAIVVLMTDHSEEHWHEDDWWQAAPEVTRASFQSSSAGHGAHALSMLQNRVFMAWRGYGALAGAIKPGTRPAWASLTDITPTLLDGMLDHQPPAADGISLWQYITTNNADSPAPRRHLFIETGFTPPAILSGNPDLGELVRQSMGYYDVLADGRLTLRERMLPGLIRDKQRAVVRDGWILGLVPGRPGGTLAVVGHIASRQWWPLGVEGDPGPPAEAPVTEMLHALCGHFAGDGDFRGRHRYCNMPAAQ